MTLHKRRDTRPSEGDPRSPSRVRGRPFTKGNGGRKPGSRNKTTLAAQALLKGEEVQLVRKAIELAKDGDPQMLKFLLDRVLPKERSVHVDLPDVAHPSFDAVSAMEAVIGAVSAGQIAPSEAAALASLFETYARIMDVAELQEALENVETKFRNMRP
jgi:hypothetical protein